MSRTSFLSSALALLLCVGASAQSSKGQLATGRDSTDQLLQAQGEYVGEVDVVDPTRSGPQPLGAQLVALCDQDGSNPRLQMVLHLGGLPGAGWRRGDPRRTFEAPLVDGVAEFTKGKLSAKLVDGELVFAGKEGEETGRLKKVARQSPTLGATPPAGAVVLFDGSSADAFEGGRLLEGGLLGVGCDSRQRFADHRIHLEFRTPFQPEARGQGRGNSGVYVQGRYECQVLDSFGLDGKQNECGGIYSIAEPIVNACLPPGTWQTYDITFTAARWSGLVKKRDARMTVHLNGILVHDDVALPNVTTAAKRKESDSAGGLYLQNHGNPVAYRNVWVVENDPQRTRRVVFVSGGPSHGYAAHEHRAGCMLLADAIRTSGLPIETEVHVQWPKDEQAIERADVLVCFADGGGRHPFLRHMEELAPQMARGLSLVCIHYAVEVPKGKPGDRFVDWLGGYFETHWSVNPHWTAEFTAIPEHPIGRGVRPFAIHDEWYFHMRFQKGMQGVTPILSAVAPESTMRRKDGPHSGNPAVREDVANAVPQHVGWAFQRPDGGRSFGFTGGHVHWNWGHRDFRTLVLNAIAWCADVDVPEGGVPSETPDLKALQANQSGKPGKNFDPAKVERLLGTFRK
jgi:hypothetical protein